jgi:Uma2 family endonuclease
MSTSERIYTADDLYRMPDDGARYELVRGELRKTAPAGHVHGRITINFTTPLDRHVRTHKLGSVYAAETGFKLASGPDVVRAPDVAFVRRERVEEVGDVDGYWPGAPDLAFEVVSPHDVYTEVEERVFDWLDAGARMVVVLNPRKRAVTVYRSLNNIVVLTETDTFACDDVVPGFQLSVAEVFS